MRLTDRYPFYQKLMKGKGNPYHDAQGHWTSKAKAVGIGIGGVAASEVGVLGEDNASAGAVGIGNVTGGTPDVSSNVSFGSYSPTTEEQDYVGGSVPKMVSAQSGGLTVKLPAGYEALGTKLIAEYNSLPKALKRTEVSVYFSSHSDPNDAELSKLWGAGVFTIAETVPAGASPSQSQAQIYVWGNEKGPQALDLPSFAHELAHNLDGARCEISNGTGYRAAIASDTDHINKMWASHPDVSKSWKTALQGSDGNQYVSEYAKKAHDILGGREENREDFADSVKWWVEDKQVLKDQSPARLKFIDSIMR